MFRPAPQPSLKQDVKAAVVGSAEKSLKGVVIGQIDTPAVAHRASWSDFFGAEFTLHLKINFFTASCPRLSILFAAGYYAKSPQARRFSTFGGFDLGDDYFQ
jgi:hypothetical protein